MFAHVRYIMYLNSLFAINNGILSVASLGLMSPGAATDGVIPFPEKSDDLILLSLWDHFS